MDKTSFLNLRFDDEQLRIVHRAAKAAGVSVTDLARPAILTRARRILRQHARRRVAAAACALAATMVAP